MSEHHHPDGVLRQSEVPTKLDRTSPDLDLLIARRRIVACRARRGGPRDGSSGTLEAGDDLFVRGLGEVVIELPDRVERIRRL
jgi:hypothetical protein